MTTTATALVPVQPAFSNAERRALAGFLAGYRGLTREACALDLRQFTAWCRNQSLPLFAVRRAGIESFARDLEAKGRARATRRGGRALTNLVRFSRPGCYPRQARRAKRPLRRAPDRLPASCEHRADGRIRRPPQLHRPRRQICGS